MKRSDMLRSLLLTALMVGVMLFAAPAFANGGRGGGGGGFLGGGGGGFHGGGGGGGFHGGGGWGGGGGGYHGGWGGSGGYRGGYAGYRGGYGGYRGGYWGGGYRGGYWGGYRGGYCCGWGWGGGWGWGWGFGVSLNFGGPWGYGYGYPYYGYPAYSPYPYSYYPYYSSPGYYYAPVVNSSSNDPAGSAYVQADDPPQNYTGLSQPQISTPRQSPNASSLKLYEATYVARPPNYRSNSPTIRNATYESTAQSMTALRPEVANVIRALRAMPPNARQQQIDSGRYDNLSPREMQVVRTAVNLPPS
jgi:hypothetical protein